MLEFGIERVRVSMTLFSAFCGENCGESNEEFPRQIGKLYHVNNGQTAINPSPPFLCTTCIGFRLFDTQHKRFFFISNIARKIKIGINHSH